MLTTAELKNAFNDVLRKMAEAGWVHRFTYTDGKGWHITWTPPGAQRAELLKRIALSHGLDQNDGRTAVAFDIVAQGGKPEGMVMMGSMDPELAAFWRRCISEVGISRQGDELLVFVHIIVGWG